VRSQSDYDSATPPLIFACLSGSAMSAARKSASLCVQNWRSRSAFIHKQVFQNNLRPGASPPHAVLQLGGLAPPGHQAHRWRDGGRGESGSLRYCIPIGYSDWTSPPRLFFSCRLGGQAIWPAYWRAGLAKSSWCPLCLCGDVSPLDHSPLSYSPLTHSPLTPHQFRIDTNRMRT
jgi:hypothetical protein